MPKTDSLAFSLARDFPQFTFQVDTYDHWSSSNKTIYYSPNQPHYSAYLLHELAHALLDHRHYKKDIELLGMERDAWQYAIHQLAPVYAVTIADTLVQHSLDSYRDWIHAKSACPKCDQTGLQSTATTYNCIACQHAWRVNTGVDTAIRRYSYA